MKSSSMPRRIRSSPNPFSSSSSNRRASASARYSTARRPRPSALPIDCSRSKSIRSATSSGATRNCARANSRRWESSAPRMAGRPSAIAVAASRCARAGVLCPRRHRGATSRTRRIAEKSRWRIRSSARRRRTSWRCASTGANPTGSRGAARSRRTSHSSLMATAWR